MRVKNTTQRFQVFVRDLQESFWGDFQGRTREMLKKLLETDAQQQMADGVWLKVRRAFGPQRVLLLVAYGIRQDGTRQLLAFTRAKSESQAGWEGLLNDRWRRGLRGENLQFVITDGCPGLARAAGDGLSAGATPALLGAQDAEYLGESTTERREAGQGSSAEDLFGG